jgi:hypothetical protein
MFTRALPVVLLFLPVSLACGGTTAAENQPAACGAASAQPVILTTVSGDIDALASDGTDLYWLDGHAGTLNAVPVAGGSSRVVATFAPLWNGPCGGQGGSSTLFCAFFSMALDAENVYAAGPLGIVAAPKSGGASRSLLTRDGLSDYVMGPIVLGSVPGGGALFWPDTGLTVSEGNATLTMTIDKLDLAGGAGGAPQVFVGGAQQVASASMLTADASNLYWLGTGGDRATGGVQATPLAGGATTAVVSSDSLAVASMAIAGSHLVWANQEQMGGCVCPGPQGPQLPEMVEAAPVAGGTPTTLVTYPGDIDPTVIVLGDASFAYVVAQTSNVSLVAVDLANGATSTLVGGSLSIDTATLDTCNVYFASGSTLEKVAKP